MTTKQNDLVTKAYCKERRSVNKWAFGVLVALLLGFLSAVGFALKTAYASMDKTAEVSEKFGRHEAAQVETTKNMESALDRIEAHQNTDRELLHKILQNGSK